MNGAPRLKRQPKGIYPGMGAGSGSGGIYISPSRHPAYSPILPEDIGGIGCWLCPRESLWGPRKEEEPAECPGLLASWLSDSADRAELVVGARAAPTAGRTGGRGQATGTPRIGLSRRSIPIWIALEKQVWVMINYEFYA